MTVSALQFFWLLKPHTDVGLNDEKSGLVAASQAYSRLRELRGKGSFHLHISRAEGSPVIAVDTGTWIGFLQGNDGEDAELLDKALQDRRVLMAPVVLAELLGDSKLPSEVSQTPPTCRSSKSNLAIGNGQASCERGSWQSAARLASAMH